MGSFLVFCVVVVVICVMRVFIFVFMGVMSLPGCEQPHQIVSSDYLIKAGQMVISRDFLLAELDLKLSAYPYDVKTDPELYNGVIVDLVSTLSEETLLLEKAAQTGITVSQSELASEEARLRAEYPDDTFQQMLPQQ